MKKIVGVLVLSLSIAGCAQLKEAFTPQTNPLNTTNLYEGELVFDGSVKTFNTLKGLCVRRVLPPVCRAYVLKGQNIIRNANAADKAAQQFVVANPTLDATNVIQAFNGLVTDFKTNLDNLSATKAQ